MMNPQATQTIGVAVIGCGKIAERLHVPQYLEEPTANVRAFVDVDLDAARALAERFELSDVQITNDVSTLCADDDIEAVSVCVPNYLHAHIALPLLEAGKHVFVEKPMALTVDEARAMMEMAQRHGACLMVDFTHRFNPVHETARQFLRDGELGQLTLMRGHLGSVSPKYWSQESKWFFDRSRSGGGALVDLGIHLVDLVLWTVDPATVVEVSARTDEPDEAGVEYIGLVQLRFDNGLMASLEVSWKASPYEVTSVWYGDRGRMRTDVQGEKPLEVVFSRPIGELKADERTWAPPVPPHSKLGGPVQHFLRCVEAGPSAESSGHDGLRALEVVLVAYESAQTDRAIRVTI